MSNGKVVKLFFSSFCVFIFLIVSTHTNADVELSFRSGAVVVKKEWEGSQFKTGINIGFTNKGANSGFYTSTSIDFSLGNDITAFYLTPEFQYDIKIEGLPLYLYPKFGINLMFLWWSGPFYWEDMHKLGLGLKVGFGAKYDITEKIFCYFEPLGLNVIFYPVEHITSDWTGVTFTKTSSILFDFMFGIGFRP